MAGFSSTVTIEELGADGSAIRVLELRGPGLPKQGANWGGESVVPTTWYPGNPDEATQQVLVSKELPTKWEMMWHLTMLLRTPSRLADPSGLAGIGPQSSQDVTSPGLLADVFDDMRRKGRPLRVTWTLASDNAGTKRTIQRIGRIVRCDFKYKHAGDVDGDVEWSWKSRGGRTARVTTTRGDNLPSAATALQNAANASIAAATISKFNASNPLVRNSANRFTLGQLEQFAQYPQRLLKTVTNALSRIVLAFNDVGQLVVAVAGAPDAAAKTALDLAADTLDLANQFVDQMEANPFELSSTSNTLPDVLRSFRHFARVDDQVQTTAQKARDLRAQFTSTRSTNPGGGSPNRRALAGSQARDFIAVIKTRAGDTARSLSVRFYNSPDHDVTILRANALPWHQVSFDPGTLLVIPALQGEPGLS